MIRVQPALAADRSSAEINPLRNDGQAIRAISVPCAQNAHTMPL